MGKRGIKAGDPDYDPTSLRNTSGRFGFFSYNPAIKIMLTFMLMAFAVGIVVGVQVGVGFCPTTGAERAYYLQPQYQQPPAPKRVSAGVY